MVRSKAKMASNISLSTCQKPLWKSLAPPAKKIYPKIRWFVELLSEWQGKLKERGKERCYWEIAVPKRQIGMSCLKILSW